MSGLTLPKSKIAVVSVFFVALLMLLVAFVPQQNTSQSSGVNVPQAAPKTYNVNFTETGFSGYTANAANGWYWYVSLSSVGTNSSLGVTNSFQLRNGTYSFYIGYYNSPYSYAINPSSGTIYVNGNTNGITVDVTFSNITTPAVKTYDANFTVTNLPAVIPNVTWSYDVSVVGIDVSYSYSSSSSGTTIKFNGLPIGSYEYSVSGTPFGTSLTPVSGSFTISKNVTIDLTFTLLKDYKLNFDSSGLTAAQSFSVTILTGGSSGTNYLESNSSYPSLSYVEFHLPNGTYYYTVSSSSNGLSPNPSRGTIDINGGNVVLNVQFTTSPKSYSVTFQVINMPSNLQNYQFNFYVQINGYYYFLQNYGPSITFSLRNGTYSFGDGFYGSPPVTLTSGLSPSSGNFVVQGKSVVINLTLLPPQPVYQVKLMESGLPSGQYFSGSVGNKFNATLITSSNDYIGFNLPNGSYYYFVNAISGFGESPSHGQIIVNGASVAIQIAFYRGFYVNFTASNLPSNIPNGGFGWEINLINSVTGNSYNRNSNGPKISFSSMPAGVYTYAASTTDGGYQILKPSGTVTVNTTNVNVILNVSLVKLYTVTFTETGLVPLPGTEWGVVVDNGFVYSSNSLAGFGSFSGVPATMTFTLTLPNGTYSVQGFTVGNNGYATFTSPHSISVNGKMSNNSIAFSNSAPSTSNNSAALTDTVLGVVGGLAVGIAAVTAFMYFRKKPPAVTPKSE